VNAETPTTRQEEQPHGMHIWGPTVPLAFLTGKIEDVGKPVPSANATVPAVGS
jgi:hypothetical protein